MVNDENVGELLIEGLKEAMAHQRGEGPWLKTVRRFRPPLADELLSTESTEDDDPGPGRRW